jgi:hypothetical protein
MSSSIDSDIAEKITKDAVDWTMEKMSEHVNFDKKICRLVNLNVRKVNNSWKNTRDYIGCFDRIKYSSSKQKLLNSKRDIIELKVDVPPYIYVDESGNVEFYNGRNRFANLRNANVLEMPFVVEKKDYKKLVKILK